MLVIFDSYAALLCFMLIFGICWGVVDVTANNATVLAEIVGFAALIYDQTQESYILKFNREQQADHQRTSADPETDAYAPLEQDVYNSIVSESKISGDLFVAEELEHGAQQEKQSSSRSTYLSLSMGAVGFLGTFSEACMITWIVIYYKEVLHASTSKKAVGFGCLFVSMAVGRFSCDFLRGRYGNKMVVFGSGLLVAIGLWLIFAMSFVQHSVVLTSFGVSLMGLGVSTLNPIAFSTAGHLAPLQ
eukprot:gene22885-25920_t